MERFSHPFREDEDSKIVFRLALSDISRLELNIYSDASEKAIAAAAYCVGYTGEMILSKSLVMGKAKVAPKNGHTIPRLELCAPVLATEIYDTVLTESGLSFHETFFFTLTAELCLVTYKIRLVDFIRL